MRDLETQEPSKSGTTGDAERSPRSRPLMVRVRASVWNGPDGPVDVVRITGGPRGVAVDTAHLPDLIAQLQHLYDQQQEVDRYTRGLILTETDTTTEDDPPAREALAAAKHRHPAGKSRPEPRLDRLAALIAATGEPVKLIDTTMTTDADGTPAGVTTTETAGELATITLTPEGWEELARHLARERNHA